MRIRKTLSIILVLAMIIILSMGSLISYAVNEKDFYISISRYVNGSDTRKEYALKDGVSSDGTPKKIFQILSNDGDTIDGKTYYCLNALKGTWLTDENAEIKYNKSYKLQADVEDGELGIDALKNDPTTTYSNIANSEYLYEILWILDNIYVPSTETGSETKNNENKQALLNAAGMVLEHVVDEEEESNTADMWKYKFKSQTSDKYNYFDALNNLYPGNNEFGAIDNKGWWYIDVNNNVQNVVISDDLIEVAQQAAIWYYTNYKDNNTNNENNRFNIKEKGLKNLSKK